MKTLSEVISPDNLAPCANCFRIPKVIVMQKALCGKDVYMVKCACQVGTHGDIDRDAVIDDWNRNQAYEDYEWARAFSRRMELETYGPAGRPNYGKEK